jgi:pimeloyl-ACP methyl ester carboxylesterase
MALFVFVHGGGDSGATFDLVSEALRARGHDAVAPDLPNEEPGAGLEDYAAVVSAAAGGREDVVLVGHSLGGFAATLAAAQMSPGEWWENAGYGAVEAADDPYWHDVPAGRAERASARERGQEGKPMEEPWPLDAWPDVPTHFLLLRGDRFFPPDFMRLVRERLGIESEELDGGHMVMLSRPRELAAYAG